MIDESPDRARSRFVVTRQVAVVILGLVAIVTAGCKSGESSVTTDPDSTNVSIVDSTNTTGAFADLPADFAGRTVGRSTVFTLASGSSITETGNVSSDVVDVFTIAANESPAANYDVSLTSPEGLAILSIYDPEGVRIMNGTGGITFNANVPGEYLVVVSGEGDTAYELTTAGTG